MVSQTSSAWKIIPQFSSTSVKKTVQFYTEELCFTLGGLYPDDDPSTEPTFCSIFIGQKADANIYFFGCNKKEFHKSAAMIALGTRELDEFYDALRAKGTVVIKEPIGDKEWGYRQFTIADNDGNELTFFKFLEGGNPGEE